MLIRFVAKNLFSFNEQTEFNVLPDRTRRLSHHKVAQNGVDVLRLASIYGANGSGKSNLIKAISLLASMIKEGCIINNVGDKKFKLKEQNGKEPISLGIEFYHDEKIFYYTLTFDDGVVLNESLFESNKQSDDIIFEKTLENGKQKIVFWKEYATDPKNKLFVEIIEEKLLQKDELLLSFLSAKYKEEFKDVSTAHFWFANMLIMIMPTERTGPLAQIFHKDDALKDFTSEFMSTLGIGVSKINIVKQKFTEFAEGTDLNTINEVITSLEKNPTQTATLIQGDGGDQISLVHEEKEVFAKKITLSHLNNIGQNVDFSMGMESDGTRRLLDYMPAFDAIINTNRVYIIDEIERSIHPLTIKEILRKISLDENIKGQLIFTTHESCLLDQDILRPDEIWFAQKDVDGASKLYSLSDYNTHHTANIENGYLNGRYGGIPFLSNLKDLNWHQHEFSK